MNWDLPTESSQWQITVYKMTMQSCCIPFRGRAVKWFLLQCEWNLMELELFLHFSTEFRQGGWWCPQGILWWGRGMTIIPQCPFPIVWDAIVLKGESDRVFVKVCYATADIYRTVRCCIFTCHVMWIEFSRHLLHCECKYTRVREVMVKRLFTL